MNTIYKKIIKNKNKFEKILDKISDKNDLSENLIIANLALFFAVKQNTGYYVSNKLETFYCNCAKQIRTDLSDINYEKNSVLHVATLTCNVGGHSRVIERWIELSPEEEKHSVVLLDQNCDIPQKLKDNIAAKSGKLHVFDRNENILEKAELLRKLAMKFEYIVLHIHMEDPTAVIAFGTEEFKRPVIFFNHADHLFWIGKSIADKVVDFRTIQSVSKSKRGINNPFILPIPAEKTDNKRAPQNEARNKLNLANDKKIILTIGSGFKYTPLNYHSLISPLKSIVEKNPNTICIAIGPCVNDPMWQKAYEETNGKIKSIGTINYDKEYFDYINASDLVIDSWPMSGGTMLKDAISCHKPILSLKNEIGQCDYVLQSYGFCETENELIQKACEILTDGEKAKGYAQNIRKNFLEETDTDTWKNQLSLLISDLPQNHSVKNLSKEKDINKIDDHSILLNHIYTYQAKKIRNSKFIKSIFKYYLYKYFLKNACKRNKYLEIIIEQYFLSK